MMYSKKHKKRNVEATWIFFFTFSIKVDQAPIPLLPHPLPRPCSRSKRGMRERLWNENPEKDSCSNPRIENRHPRGICYRICKPVL